MKRTYLIVNANSGSASTIDDESLSAALSSAGLEIVERCGLPEAELPDRQWLEQHDIEVVAIVSGDGTISGLCQSLKGWDGAIFVLPGGTMNLLSRRLHGELTLAQMVEQMGVSQFKIEAVPVIVLGEQEIFTGLTVGPSTRWGEVREVIRQGDVAAIAETVPAAWTETLDDSGVWLEGQKSQPYAGIFVEPKSAVMLSVIAFRANHLGDMLGHGIAWLRRDFREGPRDDLGLIRDVRIMGDPTSVGILVDGELDDTVLPIECHAGMSSVRFMRLVSQ